MHVREVRPKDFYFAQILRNNSESLMLLVDRTILNREVLEEYTAFEARSVIDWCIENLLHEKIFAVENWLEVSYHLCKQRWDQSIDWLENQPMSKILTMISIVEKHADQQEKAAKKNSRRRR